jgi:hypothetical protein
VVSDLEGEMTETYFGNVLSSFENGLQLDLRVKLAVDFLKAPGLFTSACEGTIPDAKVVAAAALDLSDALLAEAAARGLVKSLPDTGEIPTTLRHHIERSVRAQVFQQVVAQRIGPEEAPAVQVNGGRLPLHQ